MLLVYSVDIRQSFEEVLRCLDDILVFRANKHDSQRPRRLPVIAVANKIDLVRRREVSSEGQSLYFRPRSMKCIIIIFVIVISIVVIFSKVNVSLEGPRNK